MQCFVYRCEKKKGLYLYLSQKDDLSTIPAGILAQLGETEFSFEFELHADRKMAQVDAKNVIEGIKENGFYLQMPSDIEPLLAAISAAKKMQHDLP